jgi:hypothetical protein
MTGTEGTFMDEQTRQPTFHTSSEALSAKFNASLPPGWRCEG